MSYRIFLLGGYDLEMQTIRELLDKLRIDYVDKKHGWNNALLSEYRDILDEYAGKPDCTIYGIELKEDVPPPSNYVRIDHHNDFIDRPSSIEQVLSVLNITPDRHQQLVGANDARYIPGMLALGATRQEVDEIRKADRKAQGVTDEDERAAEYAIGHNLRGDSSGIFIVKTSSSKFSPICDRLYPYHRLVIYSDTELMFYGADVARLRSLFAEDILSQKVFYGGGDSGYLGTVSGSYTAPELESMVARIKKIFTDS